jgi:lysophospholipase L1-like esterase
MTASGTWPLLRKRGAALAIGLASATAIGEALCRALPTAAYRPPEIWLDDGTAVPMSEGIPFFRDSRNDLPASHPASRIRPNLHFRFHYDRPTWSYFESDGCVDVLTNSLGFRDHEFEVKKRPGELRILAVGDSFTFGYGVRLSDCWTEVLERMLRSASEGRPVEVINAGFATGGHDPVGYEEWVKTDGLALEPDIVLLGFCLNDMGDGVPLVPPLPPRIPLLGGVSALLNRIQAVCPAAEEPEEGWRIGDLIRYAPEPWEQCKQAIRRMRPVAEKNGAKLYIAIFPMLWQLSGRYPYLELHEMVRAFCADERIEYVDLLERFSGKDAAHLWVHMTDQHPNDEGHRLIAEGVFDFLKGRK